MADPDGIPVDENGVPLYFVLPAAARAKYERRMKRCERGWRTSGDPAFIEQAKTWTHLYRQPDPLWLTEAVIDLCTKHRTKGYATRILNAAVRKQRYEAVREAKRRGMSWPAAYEAAAEALAGTRAKGEPETMKAAYNKVVADLKNGRGGRYLQPLPQNKKLGRNPSPR